MELKNKLVQIKFLVNLKLVIVVVVVVFVVMLHARTELYIVTNVVRARVSNSQHFNLKTNKLSKSICTNSTYNVKLYLRNWFGTCLNFS